LLANPRLGDGDYVLGVIAGGRRAMPAFGNVLTEEEIAATTRFVQALEAAGGPE
jgi:mono/diheme cytochrome c family protein